MGGWGGCPMGGIFSSGKKIRVACNKWDSTDGQRLISCSQSSKQPDFYASRCQSSSMTLVRLSIHWNEYGSVQSNLGFFFFTITDDISLGIEHETKEGRRVSNAFLKAAKIHEILHCPRPLDKSKYLLKNAIKILDFFLKNSYPVPEAN